MAALRDIGMGRSISILGTSLVINGSQVFFIKVYLLECQVFVAEISEAAKNSNKIGASFDKHLAEELSTPSNWLTPIMTDQ